jgi:hypothetical protein
VPPCLCLRYLNRGWASLPLTFIFENMSNCTPYLSPEILFLDAQTIWRHQSRNWCWQISGTVQSEKVLLNNWITLLNVVFCTTTTHYQSLKTFIYTICFCFFYRNHGQKLK